jgi:DNA repair protein RadD
MAITLRPYQVEAIEAGVNFFTDKKEKKHALMILTTGAGKSIVIAGITGRLPGRTLILQPSIEILVQNFRKYCHQGFRAGIYSASAGLKHMDDITFATIGSIAKKHHLLQKFDHIIIDECFPSGSIVDGKKIETIRIGDEIKSYNHTTHQIEYKKVVRLFKKQADADLLKVNFSDGNSFVCTDNHPIYTKEFGYIPAKVLTSCLSIDFTLLKDCSYEQKDNSLLCGMRNRSEKKGARKGKQGFLHGRMQNYLPRVTKTQSRFSLSPLHEGVFSRWANGSVFIKPRSRILFQRVRGNIKDIRNVRTHDYNFIRSKVEKKQFRSDEKDESNVDARHQRKNDPIFKGKDFHRSRWKRQFNPATNDTSFGNSFSNGIPDRNSYGERSISIFTTLLQSGFGFRRKKNCNRSGRSFTQTKKMEVPRSQKNRDTESIRVESVEVYQSRSGHQRPEGGEKDYVYNLEVEDNHNYFVSNILVHNCHGVNAEDGLYRSLIDSFDKIKVLGLTATPYRLSSDGMGGSMLKFLTRTRPKIFSKVIYYIQNSVLFDAGHLAPLEYYSFKTIDRGKLELNTTGTDFTESSLKEAYAEVDMTGKIIHYANRILQKRKNLLVFCTMVNEAHQIAAAIPGAVAVSGDTDKELRKKYLRELQDGKRTCVVTCGVWSTGADIPNLEAVLLGFTTMSLAVYYQRLGRVIRPYTYPDGTKKTGWVVDLGGNIHLFGKVETMQIIKGDNDLYAIWNKTKTGIRQLTNCTFRKI